MGHYAKVVDGKVVEVIVAQQDFIDQYHSGETWIKTSYNTRGGVHYLPNDPDSPPENKITPSPDQSKALRKNYAGIGDIYDSERDAFYQDCPHASWTLDEDTCYWMPPIAYPSDPGDDIYVWDEDVYQADNTKGWVIFTG
jgi:hypothetical protein|tara:strand:- start:418 stop:837 length:420 start_codon:yes stop_codon:yes gene_type:complete